MGLTCPAFASRWLIDSSGGAAWKQIQAAGAEGKLSTGATATYFATPRPVYELYDLEADASELNNLSGKPELASVERELREAMAEKMILDCDYLPLPDLMDAIAAPRKKGSSRGKQ